jgi:hypothetical protein
MGKGGIIECFGVVNFLKKDIHLGERGDSKLKCIWSVEEDKL